MPASSWQADGMDDFLIDITQSIDDAVDEVLDQFFASRHAVIYA